jgi:hypothetical protein
MSLCRSGRGGGLVAVETDERMSCFVVESDEKRKKKKKRRSGSPFIWNEGGWRRIEKEHSTAASEKVTLIAHMCSSQHIHM